ncbi:sensor histidine kinase [Salinispirillum sp. LH 10-3-1]|uniref:histidine kinase n=1 Tax=Salinispirillum sp. LH 10-3-1 TaxID=2952525 RepID=A0AB38YG42_9GAMM
MKKISHWFGPTFSAWCRTCRNGNLVLLSWLMVGMVSADSIELHNGAHRYDLHHYASGVWLEHWEPEYDAPARTFPSAVPNRGFDDGIFHWRADISNQSDEQIWYLVVRNPSIDRLRISYTALADAPFHQTGDHQNPQRRLFPGNHFVIPLTFDLTPQTLYITATSDDWQFYPMMLVNQTGYQTFVQQEMLAIGAVTGLLLAVFLFNLLQTLLKTHWSFLWAAGTAMLWVVHVWFWYGLGYLWLWPDSPWMQQHIWYLLLPCTGALLLASVVAACTRRLSHLHVSVLNWGAGLGAVLLLGSYVLLSKAAFINITWLWFALLSLLFLYWTRHERRIWTLQMVLAGYIGLSGLFFLYFSVSAHLFSSHMLLLFLLFAVLTALHSFAVYWQYHMSEQKAWRDLQRRSQAYEDQVDEGREILARYRSALESGRSWRYAFTRNLQQRFNVIEAAVTQLRQSVLAEERHELLNQALVASQEGARYISDLSHLEQVLADGYIVDREPMMINDWLSQFDAWFDTQEESGQLFFRAELTEHTDPPPPVIGPATTLHTICLRLLENALQHTQAGFVKLLVEMEGLTDDVVYCAFEVRDSGSGMTPDLVAAIQAFWQQAATPDQQHRLGSGLTIALTLLQKLDASLHVQSTEKAGTSIRFAIALQRQHQEPELGSESAPAP